MGDLSVQFSKKTPTTKATPPATSNAIVGGLSPNSNFRQDVLRSKTKVLTSILALIEPEQQTHNSTNEEKEPDEVKLTSMFSERLAAVRVEVEGEENEETSDSPCWPGLSQMVNPGWR